MKIYRACASLVICWSSLYGGMYEQLEQQDEEYVSSSKEVSRPTTRVGLARLLGSEGFKSVIQRDMSDQEIFGFLNSTYVVRYDQTSDFFLPVGKMSSLEVLATVSSDIEHKNFVFFPRDDGRARVILIGTRNICQGKRLSFFIEEVGIIYLHDDGSWEAAKGGFLDLNDKYLKMLRSGNYVYEPFIGFSFDDSSGERLTLRLLVLGTRELALAHRVADYLKMTYFQY